jgi:hypothetical protein
MSATFEVPSMLQKGESQGFEADLTVKRGSLVVTSLMRHTSKPGIITLRTSLGMFLGAVHSSVSAAPEVAHFEQMRGVGVIV